MLKVNDRVVAITREGGRFHNKKGTVIYAHKVAYCGVLIEFDCYVSGHDGQSDVVKGKEGHCWWISKNCLERINKQYNLFGELI